MAPRSPEIVYMSAGILFPGTHCYLWTSGSDCVMRAFYLNIIVKTNMVCEELFACLFVTWSQSFIQTGQMALWKWNGKLNNNHWASIVKSDWQTHPEILTAHIYSQPLIGCKNNTCWEGLGYFWGWDSFNKAWTFLEEIKGIFSLKIKI